MGRNPGQVIGVAAQGGKAKTPLFEADDQRL
jgi:hypothetical protein